MAAEAQPPQPSTRGEVAALVALLAAAAALRFPGLTHHVVRGAPDFDEQNNFVQPILRMWREGSLDPGVYQGYAGFFNWLAAMPVLLGERLAGPAGAYGAARGLVAVFGVLNVLLAFLVARRLAGPLAGLYAAALLALSRLDVRAAHHVTPDVLVATAVLGVLLIATRPSPAGDLKSGIAIGLAAAVKYTGLFAGVPAGTALLLQRRWRRLPMVALAAAVTFGLAAPYAIVTWSERGSRASGLAHYYGERAARARDARGGGAAGLSGAMGWLLQGVGPVGAGLALVGLALGPDRRRLAPAAVTVGAGVVAMAAAAYLFPRHAVPPAAALTVLAGAGFGAATLRARRAGPLVAALLALASLPLQARASIRLTLHYLEPSAVEQAALWIEREVRREALVATSLPRFAIDPVRFEVRRLGELAELPRAALAQVDFVVCQRTEEPGFLPDFRVLAQFPSEDRLPERTVTILAPPTEARGALRIVVPKAFDTSAPGVSEALFEAPARLLRIELDIADRGAWPQDLALMARMPGSEGWAPLAADTLRPTTDERQRRGGRRGQVFVVRDPAPVSALRILCPKGGLAAARFFARDAELKEQEKDKPPATRKRRRGRTSPSASSSG